MPLCPCSIDLKSRQSRAENELLNWPVLLCLLKAVHVSSVMHHIHIVLQIMILQNTHMLYLYEIANLNFLYILPLPSLFPSNWNAHCIELELELDFSKSTAQSWLMLVVTVLAWLVRLFSYIYMPEERVNLYSCLLPI